MGHGENMSALMTIQNEQKRFNKISDIEGLWHLDID